MAVRWASYGLPLDDFWFTSIAEIAIIFEGAQMRARREHDERMHMVWMGAQLTAYAPDKADRFIRLDKILLDRPQRPRQSWQTIKAAMMIAMPPKR